MSIEELDTILVELNYYEKFKDNFLYAEYPAIDYGKRIGKLKFNSIIDAGQKYTYGNLIEEVKFVEWNQVLTDINSTEEDVFITCLEIFEWGNVLNGNVKSAIELYKEKKLKSYLLWIKELLTSDETLKVENYSKEQHKIIWSSGWTKVYSFINNDILIYDSRVSAFLNHTLTYKESNKTSLDELTKHLYNFNGAIGRKRQVDKYYSFKNQHPNGIMGFNANLISSWVIQLLASKLDIEISIRTFERAFFMLGFDLKQIE